MPSHAISPNLILAYTQKNPHSLQAKKQNQKMTKSLPTGQLQDSPIPDDKPDVQIVALTPPAATGPKSTPLAKPISKSMMMVGNRFHSHIQTFSCFFSFH